MYSKCTRCDHVQRLDLDSQLHKLKVVHVAGTKGKVSTMLHCHRCCRVMNQQRQWQSRQTFAGQSLGCDNRPTHSGESHRGRRAQWWRAF